MTAQNNTMNTADFYLSAFLLTQGYNLVRLEALDNRKLFCFESNDKIRVIKNEYYTLQTTVEPNAFKAAIKQLKARIVEFDEGRWHNS